MSSASVDRDDVLLASEQVEDGVGLVVVVTQPDLQRVLGVVGPHDQLAAAHVAASLQAWTVRHEVVVHAARRAQPAGQHAATDLVVGQVEVDDRVDVVALEEELRLAPVPREAVDDKAVVPVVLLDPCLHDRLDQVVPDQLTCGHHATDLRAELRVVLDVPAEDLAHAVCVMSRPWASRAAWVPLPLPCTPMSTYFRRAQETVANRPVAGPPS